MTDARTLSDWARVFMGTLARAGVETIAISPGSRSTPLVWAALEEPGLALESIVDERDAAFWAVGRAKITGRPTALLCTSGSAAANYFPAVVEAALSGTPLVIVTADRPYELMQTGASQTIDQVKIFGGYARYFADIGMPDGSEGALRALRRAVVQAVHVATGDAHGPVHLNFRARKPLEPEAGGDALAGARLAALLSEPLPRASRARRLPALDGVQRLVAAAAAARRPLVVCGPVAPSSRVTATAIADLARALGAPVFAETSSGVRHGMSASGVTLADAYGTLAQSARLRAALRPDLVVQLGTTPISAGYAAVVTEAPRPTRFVLTASDWMDPQSSATEVLFGDLDASVDALREAISPAGAGARREWLDEVRRVNAAVWAVVDRELERAGWSEGLAVRSVVDALTPGSVLALGNSLPVREVDLVARARDAGVLVWSQRGASGIDGLVAGAAGAADASGRPTTLLIGDVSLLHDLGGLALARSCRVPLRIVVLHNGGGRIFDQLPVGSRADLPAGAMRFWTTPQTDGGFEHAAAQFGIPYARVEGPEALTQSLCAEARGVALIEVRVPPDSAKRFVEELRRGLEGVAL